MSPTACSPPASYAYTQTAIRNAKCARIEHAHASSSQRRFGVAKTWRNAVVESPIRFPGPRTARRISPDLPALKGAREDFPTLACLVEQNSRDERPKRRSNVRRAEA